MNKQRIKKNILKVPLVSKLTDMMLSSFPRVFLYHRFSQIGSLSPHRVSVDNFRWQLERISRGYNVLSFGDCLEQFNKNGVWPKRCAIITVDDGYRDFYQLAYPELQRYSLPATFFVTVNFVDKKIWLWPDRLMFSIENTRKKDLKIRINGDDNHFWLFNENQKLFAWKTLSDVCINLRDNDKENLITEVEKALDVELSSIPSSEYAAVTWQELEEMQRNGIEIGSHTMNHPVLSRIDSERLRYEVTISRATLEKKLKAPVRTFCYPNGQPGDINDEVVTSVRDAGYIGAPFFFDLTNWDPFLVPRLGVSNDRDDFLAKLAGLELLSFKLKKQLGRRFF